MFRPSLFCFCLFPHGRMQKLLCVCHIAPRQMVSGDQVTYVPLMPLSYANEQPSLRVKFEHDRRNLHTATNCQWLECNGDGFKLDLTPPNPSC